MYKDGPHTERDNVSQSSKQDYWIDLFFIITEG